MSTQRYEIIDDLYEERFNKAKNIKSGNVNVKNYEISEEEDISLKLLGSLISNAINSSEDAKDMYDSVKNILKNHNIYYEKKQYRRKSTFWRMGYIRRYQKMGNINNDLTPD